MTDPRIAKYRAAAEAMKRGLFDTIALETGDDDIGLLGRALTDLGQSLDSRFREISELLRVTEKINAGLILDEVLEHVYASFHVILPYDRIGVSLIEDHGATVRARWARSAAAHIEIAADYSAPLAGSSLQHVLATGEPRILNDLPGYLAEHPQSESTRLIVNEGMLSSLTCPLIALGKPIGFMFFSSMALGAYRGVHVELFLQVAGQLAMVLEKSRLYQQVLELHQVKDRFLGVAAHDLRGPLTAIRGFLELLIIGEFGETNSEQQEILNLLIGNSDAMLFMVNDLLDISGIQSGHLDLRIAPVRLDEQLQQALAFNGGLARLKSMTLELDMDGPLPTVPCDPLRIRQVLDNLISNAIKYSFPGTVITLRAQTTGGCVTVSVRDRGQGIPPSELSKVFTEFGKTSVQPTGNERSHGLGLAIVKRIVEAHNGRVWVESAVGQGSTFSFSLPLSAASESPGQEPSGAAGR